MKCPGCDGFGKRANQREYEIETCEVCGGTGEVTLFPKMKDPLTLEGISKTNMLRCEKWHGDGDPWTLADWGNALAGETGELCNVIKKLRRIETRVPGSKDPPDAVLRSMLKDEIGDVYLYLDLLASHSGISLAEAVRDKFNAVSDREGFEEKL